MEDGDNNWRMVLNDIAVIKTKTPLEHRYLSTPSFGLRPMLNRRGEDCLNLD